MITYWQLISMVQPFFLSRWWDDFASPERVMFYTNCALQDAYNIDAATFTYKTELWLTPTISWDTNEFELSFNINKAQDVIWYYASWSSVQLTPTLMFIKSYADFKFQVWENKIITHQDIVKIDIVYTMDYKWASHQTDSTSVIQVPNKYIPAVIKMIMDWASPVNLMSWEWSTVDFFSHAMTRFNKLAETDYQTDYIKLNN